MQPVHAGTEAGQRKLSHLHLKYLILLPREPVSGAEQIEEIDQPRHVMAAHNKGG